jgi:CBS domain-containing protein
MKVRELMCKHVATVQPQQTLDRAARLMQAQACGCVVVVDESSTLLGIVTDRDVCMAALRADKPLSKLAASSAMSTSVHTCRADQSLEEAEQLMAEHRVRRLPVVDAAGKMLGVLSLDDIAREAYRERSKLLPAVKAKSVGNTLGRINRPRPTISGRPG